jgi:hypothetical protein
MWSWGAVALATIAAMLLGAPAAAYRPFDGTDAAVADKGEVEIELQPYGILKDGPDKTVIGPATRINYGFATNWEAVVEGQVQTPLSSMDPAIFTAAGAFLKGVLREGSLQGKAGPSIATEFGLLLPDSGPGPNTQEGIGASCAAIVSQRWDWGAVHFNAQTALTRDHLADLFIGTIVEGPSAWKVRPVAEVFYENTFGQAQTVSGLVGLIWQFDDKLSFDVGLRHALTNGRPVNEVRAGLTFGFPAFASDAARRR